MATKQTRVTVTKNKSDRVKIGMSERDFYVLRTALNLAKDDWTKDCGASPEDLASFNRIQTAVEKAQIPF